MEKKLKILISKCLLGEPCRYDGKSVQYQGFEANSDIDFIPVCPEQLGGLPTPRPASEILSDKVINNLGQDVTQEFCMGAKKALDIALANNVDFAVLKSKSPSCGSGKIYDGSFEGKLVDGYGITARLLKDNNIPLMDENRFLAYLTTRK